MSTFSNFGTGSLGVHVRIDHKSSSELFQLVDAFGGTLQFGLARSQISDCQFEFDLIVNEGGVLGCPWPLTGNQVDAVEDIVLQGLILEDFQVLVWQWALVSDLRHLVFPFLGFFLLVRSVDLLWGLVLAGVFI